MEIKSLVHVFTLIKRIRNTTNGLSSLSLYSKKFTHNKHSTMHIGVSKVVTSRVLVAFTMTLRMFN